ncbi:MAG TPA: hypothetical protein VG456_19180 [Candidatus Sulfopaludibacter sp.]|jgi:hypothetical protein|nr:hypothetical protein [Candidatus Sulfopaludibacter sp.]
MGTLHISDTDLARDPYSVLAKVEGRPISACIASAKASGSKLILDEGFAKDVEEGIKERSQPWNPPCWD